jgi:hypothetical protein
MEPTHLKKYESPYGFRLYDVYEHAVLLRCKGGMLLGEDTGGNIDLIFLGVDYIELPMLLRGISISKPRDELALAIENKYMPPRGSDPGDRIFAIESEGKRFHLIASNFWVQINKKAVEESSLIPLLSNNLAERDAYMLEQVKEWYKLE